MSAAALIRRAHDAHIDITVTSAGTLKLAGPPAAIEAMTPEFRTHKPELIAHLRAANDARHLAPDPVTPPFKRWRVTVQHDGGQRSFDMLSPPDRTQRDAEASARFRFQERLISVAEA